MIYYKNKLRGMNAMKIRKIILIAIPLLLLIMFTSCGNSDMTTNINTQKLALTNKNIQKVFSNQYIVENINIYHSNVTATFVTKGNTNRKESPKLIEDIQAKMHENFIVNNLNRITLDNFDYILLGTFRNEKLIIGYVPDIYIKTNDYFHKYSKATKFNLLNPTGDMKIIATDLEDGDLTNKIILKNSDVLTKLGTQTLTYAVTDSDGNTITNNDIKIEITK